MLVQMLMPAAIGIAVWAYAIYFRDIKKKGIKPNRWSWLIWSATMAIEAFTYDAVSEGVEKSLIFFISTVCCAIITARIWKGSKRRWPTWTEFACVFASAAALVLIGFDLVLYAHLVVVAAVPIGFIPTWEDAYWEPERERSIAWPLWTLSDLLVIGFVALNLESRNELPYIIVEFLCHGSVWLLVRYRLAR